MLVEVEDVACQMLLTSAGGWGWDPASIQVIVSAVVGTLTLATLWLVFINNQLGRRESNLRTRPWVGITDIDYQRGDTDTPDDRFLIKFMNVGALPALDINLSIQINTFKLRWTRKFGQVAK